MLLWGRVADVCRDEVAESKVVQVCEPLALTDPRLVWVLLFLLLLLLPDVSEFELAGVLSLKRAVEQVEGQAQQLSTDAQRLQVTAHQLSTQMSLQSNNQTAAQGQAMYNILDPELAAKILSFKADVESDDTTPLTAEEEAGGIASLVFTSAMTGMLSELFSPWADRAQLVGWVMQEDGEIAFTHMVGTLEVRILGLVGRDLVAADPFADPVVTQEGGVVAVTAFATLSGATSGSSGSGRVLGALSVLVESDEEPTDADLEELGARAEAAAGAYGLLLLRVLGEPSTLEGPE